VQRQLHYYQAVKASPDVIDYDTQSFGKSFEMAYRGRLDDVEPSKKYKAQKQRLPCDRRRDESDELASNFVDHYKLRVFHAAGAANASRRWNTNEYSDGH
jgi:hypothetical protein